MRWRAMYEAPGAPQHPSALSLTNCDLHKQRLLTLVPSAQGGSEKRGKPFPCEGQVGSLSKSLPGCLSLANYLTSLSHHFPTYRKGDKISTSKVASKLC